MTRKGWRHRFRRDKPDDGVWFTVSNDVHGARQLMETGVEFLDSDDPGVRELGERMLRTAVLITADDEAGLTFRGVLATVLFERYGRTGDLGDLDESIELSSEAMTVSDRGDPLQIAMLLTYAQAITSRCGSHGGDPAELENAVAIWREMLSLEHPLSDPVLFRSCLGEALMVRFNLVGDRPSLDEAIGVWEQGRATTAPGHPIRPNFLPALGEAYLLRYGTADVRADLDSAVARLLEARGELTVTDTLWAACHANLGSALFTRFRRNGDAADLDQAVEILTEVTMGEADFSNRATCLAVLGRCLRARFDSRRGKADAEAAIEVLREAGQADPFARHDLVSILIAWAQLSGNAEPLDEAEREAREGEASAEEDDTSMRAEFLMLRSQSLRMRHELTGEPSAVRAAVEAAREAADLDPTSNTMHTLSRAQQQLGTFQSDPAAMEDALHWARRALAAMPEDHPDRDTFHGQVATCLGQHYQMTGDLASLEESVRAARAAVAATPKDGPDQSIWLSNLAFALLLASEAAEEPSGLQEAADLARQAVARSPSSHPNHAGYQYAVGTILGTWYERTGDSGVLPESIAAHRASVVLCPPSHSRRPQYATALCEGLRRMADVTSDPSTLREAAAFARAATSSAESRSPAWTPVETEQALALRRLAERTGDRQSLERLLSEARKEQRFRARARVVLTELRRERPDSQMTFPGGPEPVFVFDEIARSLIALNGDASLLREVIRAYRKLLDSGEGEVDTRFQALHNLATAYRELFEMTGEIDPLHKSIRVAEEALAVAGENREWRAAAVTALGDNLEVRARWSGDVTLLRRAVKARRAAADIRRANRVDQLRSMGALSLALRELFTWTGELAALKESVELGRAVAASLPVRHVVRSRAATNLSVSLRMLAERSPAPALIQEAVAAATTAVELRPPGAPGRDSALNNLAAALHQQFRETGQIEVLRAAVNTQREAVAAAPRPGLDRAKWLDNLATFSRELAAVTGDPDAITDAYAIGVRALSEAPAHREERAVLAVNQGLAALTLFTQSHDAAYLEAAGAHLTDAALARNAPAGVVIQAEQLRAVCAMYAGDAEAALTASERAVVELVPRVAPRDLVRSDREHGLSRLSDLGAEAAAAATFAGHPERAVELLEQARGILLAEELDTRGDLRRLADERPALAVELQQLRDAARRDDTEAEAFLPNGHGGYLTGTRDVAEEWAALMARIRAEPGFERFDVPPAIDDLRAQASAGPVVMVYTCRVGSGALIVTARHAVRSVALPDLALDELERRVLRFERACLLAAHGSLNERATAQQEIHGTLEWLWDCAVEPVMEALEGVQYGSRRVWWCPVGLLSYLPLHAAGHHRDETGRTVLDRVVSSYTPTIRALAHARRARLDSAPGPTGGTGLMVAMPDTPQASPLPGAGDEVEALRRLMPGLVVLTGSEATYDSVHAELPRHTVAHFACHGVGGRGDPSGGRLLLHDHGDRPLTVVDISRWDLGHAELAYLSACSTAVGRPSLINESIHITSAFQLAGYRHVIGTLWAVEDRSAVRVSTDVYAVLTAGGRKWPKVDQAAEALHEAVLQLRDTYRELPARWAAFLHVGA